jgi:uncharacterized protein YhhL (DUF1145 family)
MMLNYMGRQVSVFFIGFLAHKFCGGSMIRHHLSGSSHCKTILFGVFKLLVATRKGTVNREGIVVASDQSTSP